MFLSHQSNIKGQSKLYLKVFGGGYINRFINNPKMKAEKFVFKNLVLTLHL